MIIVNPGDVNNPELQEWLQSITSAWLAELGKVLAYNTTSDIFQVEGDADRTLMLELVYAEFLRRELCILCLYPYAYCICDPDYEER